VGIGDADDGEAAEVGAALDLLGEELQGDRIAPGKQLVELGEQHSRFRNRGGVAELCAEAAIWIGELSAPSTRLVPTRACQV
jgi:hypothetical protein